MTPDAYESLLRQLGFVSTRHVAEVFRVAPSTAQKWAKDGPSPPVVVMLEFMAALGYSAKDVEQAIGGRR